jgi:hypothetical protein
LNDFWTELWPFNKKDFLCVLPVIQKIARNYRCNFIKTLQELSLPSLDALRKSLTILGSIAFAKAIAL